MMPRFQRSAGWSSGICSFEPHQSFVLFHTRDGGIGIGRFLELCCLWVWDDTGVTRLANTAIR